MLSQRRSSIVFRDATSFRPRNGWLVKRYSRENRDRYLQASNCVRDGHNYRSSKIISAEETASKISALYTRRHVGYMCRCFSNSREESRRIARFPVIKHQSWHTDIKAEFRSPVSSFLDLTRTEHRPYHPKYGAEGAACCSCTFSVYSCTHLQCL